jgi:lipoic acid synthetase
LHLPIERYWTPDEFRALRDEGMTMGYRHVESGPLVRSSYHAERHVGV